MCLYWWKWNGLCKILIPTYIILSSSSTVEFWVSWRMGMISYIHFIMSWVHHFNSSRSVTWLLLQTNTPQAKGKGLPTPCLYLTAEHTGEAFSRSISKGEFCLIKFIGTLIIIVRVESLSPEMVPEQSPCETGLTEPCPLGEKAQSVNWDHITKREDQIWTEVKYVKTF